MVITRAMEEQLKALKEAINSMKEEMKKGQDELKERMEKGQDDLKNSFKEKINIVAKKIAGRINEKIGEVEAQISDVETKVSIIEEKLQNELICAKKEMGEEMERKIRGVGENFSFVSQKVQELKKKQDPTRTNPDDRKIMPASPAKVKLSTYISKSSWQVYKTQFAIVVDTNRWSDNMKACQIEASLRGEAADLLQTLPDLGQLNFHSLYSSGEANEVFMCRLRK